MTARDIQAPGATSRTCPQCGEPLGAKAAFCRACGSSVVADAAPAQRLDSVAEVPAPPPPPKPPSSAAPPLAKPPIGAMGTKRSKAPFVIGALALLLGAGAVVAVVLTKSSNSSKPTTTAEQAGTGNSGAGLKEGGGGEGLVGMTAMNELLSGIPQQGLTLGSPHAPVELIEFADLQCPVCKTYAEEDLAAVIEGPVAQNVAKLVFRNFLIIGEESAPAGDAAVSAGEQGRGWNFVEVFYRNQRTEESGYVTDEFLTSVAEAAGVSDIGRWNEDRESPGVQRQVKESTREAEKLEFLGAPSFAVQGPASRGLELLGTPGSAAELIAAIKAAK